MGVITASFHSVGSSCRSIIARNKIDNGKIKEGAEFLKKDAGSPSGPAPVENFNFFNSLSIIIGEIEMSPIPRLSDAILDLNMGN